MKPEENSIFGLQVYERIIDYFMDLLDEKVVNDVRTLHTLYEHKQCMGMRIKYMHDNGYIDNEPSLYNDYCNIRQKVLIQRNMHIKYLLSNDKKLIDQIIASLNEVVLLEKNILQCLLNQVKEGISSKLSR